MYYNNNTAQHILLRDKVIEKRTKLKFVTALNSMTETTLPRGVTQSVMVCVSDSGMLIIQKDRNPDKYENKLTIQ